MQEYKKFRLKSKTEEILQSGFLISLAGVFLILIFSVLDRTAVNLGSVLPWRIIGMLPMLILILLKIFKSSLVTKPNPIVLQWYGFLIILALSCMMSAIFRIVVRNSSIYSAVGLAGTTSGSILVIFGCGLFNGVSFKKSIAAVGFPYIIVVLSLLMENSLSLEERVLTANILSAFVLYSVMVWRREKNDDERLYNLFMLDQEQYMLETAVKERTQELEILLAELHHNVRNNLQTILSIVNIYEHSYSFSDSRTQFNIVRKVVQILSFSHDFSHSNNAKKMVSLEKFMAGLLDEIFDDIDIKVVKEIEDCEIPVENAVKLSLIILHTVSQSRKDCILKARVIGDFLEIVIATDGKFPEYSGCGNTDDPLFDIMKAEAVKWDENNLNYTRFKFPN